jgi:hypothetical protein
LTLFGAICVCVMVGVTFALLKCVSLLFPLVSFGRGFGRMLLYHAQPCGPPQGGGLIFAAIVAFTGVSAAAAAAAVKVAVAGIAAVAAVFAATAVTVAVVAAAIVAVFAAADVAATAAIAAVAAAVAVSKFVDETLPLQSM